MNGGTAVTLTQAQFSADRKQQVAARPLAWHVPVKASAGGATVQVVTAGPTTQLLVPGCGPLLINPGQYGYYRTLYTPQQEAALAARFPQLAGMDQFGLISNALALSLAGYQPMQPGLDLLSAMPPHGSAKVVQRAVGRWDDLYDRMEGDKAAQAAIAGRVTRSLVRACANSDFNPRPANRPATRPSAPP